VWNKFNHVAINEKFSSNPPVKTVDEKKRPVVPQRPAHTMSIYSTDIRPSPNKPLTSLAEQKSNFAGSNDSTIALPGRIPDKPAPPKPDSSLAHVEPVVSPKADYPVVPAVVETSTPRPRPKPAGITVDEVVEKLSAVCNPVDPTKLYKGLIKVGQGYTVIF
jgi:p21-activated kinase 1